MSRFFVAVYDWLKLHPLFRRIFLWGSFAVWIFFAAQISLKQDVSEMLPQSQSLRAMNDVLSHTKAGEQLIFLLSGDDSDADSLISAAETFAQNLKAAQPDFIDTITLQVSSGKEDALTEIIRSNLPLFLTEDDYKRLEHLTQPETIQQTLLNNRKLLMSPASVVFKKFVAADPIGLSNVVWERLRGLQTETSFELYDGYLLKPDHSQLTFFLKINDAVLKQKGSKAFFKTLDAQVAEWKNQYPNMQLAYFGGAAVAHGNAAQLQRDTILTLSVTLLLLMALCWYFFRKKRAPLLMLIPVVYGAAMGLAVLYLLQGSIAIIALGAGAIVLGIAMDFSIHFLSHARQASLRDTVKELAQPLTIGSFTTIAAFFSLQFAGTPVLHDLGLFAAVSLAGAALCTLIFLPHFPLRAAANPKPTLFDTLAKWKPEKQKWLVAFILLLTPLMGWFAKDVSFDSDLMHLNYLPPDLEHAQQKITEANPKALSQVYVIANGNTEDEALQKLNLATDDLQQLKTNGSIRAVSNPAAFIPSLQKQEESIRRWHVFWTKEKQQEVAQAINKAAVQTGFNPDAFTAFETSWNATFKPLDDDAVSVLKSLFPGGFSGNNGQHSAVASLRVAPEKRELVFKTLDARKDLLITDRQQGATQLASILNQDFNRIALWSSCIVFFALLLAYGRIELAIIAFLPMVISWVWILGIMSLLSLQFNIVNIIISSLIFGLGDDYTIFTMDGLVARYKTGNDKLSSTRSAVYVSVLTVLIGLGALLLAKHPALRSIAFISVTGLLCVLFISQTLQPFLFNWFIQHRADKKLLPFTASSFLKSVFAFAYFFSGSLILSIAGLLLTKLFPFGKERGKRMFHQLLSAFTYSMMHVMTNVKKRIENPYQNDFTKPAVYVANHSSFLDILIITMLHPRLILLTNKWVWRSPVFGAVVRMAEYYPADEGAEESLHRLEDLVRCGYSIAVFPEGTRSYTDRIQRFHKGAFFIAEKLQLAVVPILLHGVHYSMQKGDWLLKDGTCTVKILKPDATHSSAEGSYAQRAKTMGAYMRLQLAEQKIKTETPAYFREQLLRCYTYKNPSLEWYCRIKTRLEKNYETLHQILPRSGFYYDLGCGYGFATFMLHWAVPERIFAGIDYDESKIETAQNVHLRDEGITFQHADLNAFEMQPCTGILLQDVLHYLLPTQQKALLQKCFDALLPGGMLLIRDGVDDLNQKIRKTKQTELWSTRILKFNKTENDLYFLSQKDLEAFAGNHGMTIEMVDETKRLANVTFLLRKGIDLA